MDYHVRRRITFIFVVMVIIFGAVIAKLAWINIVDGQALRDVVQANKVSERVIPSERGKIYDRNGELLAYSKYRYKVSINLKQVTNIRSKSIEELVKLVAPIISMSEGEVYLLLTGNEGSYVNLMYVEDKNVAERLYKTYHPLLGVQMEVKRVYPNDYLASDVLGFTSFIGETFDIKGVNGIESEMNDYLTGEDGFYSTETSRRDIELVYSEPVYMPARDGNDVYLTIDMVLQYYLENALEDAYNEQNPIAAHGLIMNVNNGEVLAMGSYPNFNPETKWMNGVDESVTIDMSNEEKSLYNQGIWKNDFIESAYDLGSPIKLLTAATALEYDLYTLDSSFRDMSQINVDGTIISCWYHPHMHRNVTLKTAISDSHNPAFVEMGLAIGGERLYQAFDEFGFHDRTGIELPGEIPGISYSLNALSTNNVNLATSTYGHGETHTPLQVAMAVASVVNGGNLLQPQIVKEIEAPDGSVTRRSDTVLKRKVISEITSQQIREAMEYTVDIGSGSAAQIPGLRVGGKTGTAQKINQVDGGYYQDRGIASFIAVAPIDNPEILIYIVIDDPQESMLGSKVAAPVAKKVLEDAAYHLNLYTYDDDIELVEVPNVIGMTVKMAQELLNDNDLYGKIQTSSEYTEESIIGTQYPNAGSSRPKGKSILLEVLNE